METTGFHVKAAVLRGLFQQTLPSPPFFYYTVAVLNLTKLFSGKKKSEELLSCWKLEVPHVLATRDNSWGQHDSSHRRQQPMGCISSMTDTVSCIRHDYLAKKGLKKNRFSIFFLVPSFFRRMLSKPVEQR